MPVDTPDPTHPDLREVDLLCRLALSAKRLGCRLHLSGVSSELRSLIELAGMDGVLLDPDHADPPTNRDLR